MFYVTHITLPFIMPLVHNYVAMTLEREEFFHVAKLNRVCRQGLVVVFEHRYGKITWARMGFYSDQLFHSNIIELFLKTNKNKCEFSVNKLE